MPRKCPHQLRKLVETPVVGTRPLPRTPLARIDRWYAARTLPDPTCTADYWFERRLVDQEGWGRI